MVGQRWTCGAAKSLAGAEPAAILAQAGEKVVENAGDDRKVEVVDEKYHHDLAIGEKVTTSSIKLQVLRSLGGQNGHLRTKYH